MRTKLSDKDIWNVVNYIRSLGPKSVTQSGEDPRVFAPLRHSLPSPWSACRALALAGGCGLPARSRRTTPAAPPGPLLPGQTAGVFTTARPTMGAAVNDFLGRTPSPEQPIEFPHNVHVAKKIACTEYCHESVTTGPVAGLPSVRTCMICHDAIATDRPRIQQITRDARARDSTLRGSACTATRRRRT